MVSFILLEKALAHNIKDLSVHPADTKLRDKFILQVNELENHPIIYLDESGFKSHDYRPHGYSRKGVPCLAI